MEAGLALSAVCLNDGGIEEAAVGGQLVREAACSRKVADVLRRNAIRIAEWMDRIGRMTDHESRVRHHTALVDRRRHTIEDQAIEHGE